MKSPTTERTRLDRSAEQWRRLVLLTERMAERFAESGSMTHPETAAAVLSARGVAGDTQDRFASRLSLGRGWLAAAERGARPATSVPVQVRAESPWVNWAELDALRS